MNIFEFALNKEKQAENTYKKFAEVAPTEGMKTIFRLLAKAEKNHFEVIQKLEKAVKVELAVSEILDEAHEAISKMKLAKEQFKTATSQIELYRAAQVQEAESEKFYRENAAKSKDMNQSKILLILAEEEKQHYTVLENIIEFIGLPETRLENAEFNKPGKI